MECRSFRSRSASFFALSRFILWTLSCIQESNLNSSSSFRIFGYSALRSDRIHFRSGIISSDNPLACGCVITFVRQGLFFPELSSFFRLTPVLTVGVNISLNNFSSLSFLNVYAPPICFSSTDDRTDCFFSPFFAPPEIS